MSDPLPTVDSSIALSYEDFMLTYQIEPDDILLLLNATSSPFSQTNTICSPRAPSTSTPFNDFAFLPPSGSPSLSPTQTRPGSISASPAEPDCILQPSHSPAPFEPSPPEFRWIDIQLEFGTDPVQHLYASYQDSLIEAPWCREQGALPLSPEQVDALDDLRQAQLRHYPITWPFLDNVTVGEVEDWALATPAGANALGIVLDEHAGPSGQAN